MMMMIAPNSHARNEDEKRGANEEGGNMEYFGVKRRGNGATLGFNYRNSSSILGRLSLCELMKI